MNNLKPAEYKNQRILTTQQLAKNYKTEVQVITNNFNRNKDRYIEGKHYYCLDGEQKREFLNLTQIDLSLKNAKYLYLWTEKGALLHAKSLNTDKAWEVYDYLIEHYFRSKESNTTIENLSPQLQLLINMEVKQKELENRLDDTNKRLDSIKDIVALNPNQWRKDTAILINKIAQKCGGYEHISFIRNECYTLLEQRYGVSLNVRLTNKRKTLALNGVSKSKIDKINQVDVIADDKKLIEGFISIVKEMSIKYGIDVAM